MTPENYTVRDLELSGWPVRLITYKLGELFHAKVENRSPGATLARAAAASSAEAEQQALETAARRLERTRRQQL
jgi:hypothetical protein